MNNIYKNIEEYNPDKKRKTLIVSFSYILNHIFLCIEQMNLLRKL